MPSYQVMWQQFHDQADTKRILGGGLSPLGPSASPKTSCSRSPFVASNMTERMKQRHPYLMELFSTTYEVSDESSGT